MPATAATGATMSWRLRLADGAALDRVALVEEAAEALHLAEIAATLGTASRLDGFVLLLGGRTVRHEAIVRSGGESARIAGSTAPFCCRIGRRPTSSPRSTICAPGGETREMFKGVAAGRAHGAFQGRITVRPGAQKTDAQS